MGKLINGFGGASRLLYNHIVVVELELEFYKMGNMGSWSQFCFQMKKIQSGGMSKIFF